MKQHREYKGDIHYLMNYNHKLNCKYHTTIRLCDYSKYHLNAFYRIFKEKEYVFDGKIIGIKYCKLSDLPDFSCYLDAAMSKAQLTDYIKKIYESKQVNWENQLLAILLIENADFDFLNQHSK